MVEYHPASTPEAWNVLSSVAPTSGSLDESSPLPASSSLLQLLQPANSSCRLQNLAIESVLEVMRPRKTIPWKAQLAEDHVLGQAMSLPMAEVVRDGMYSWRS